MISFDARMAKELIDSELVPLLQSYAARLAAAILSGADSIDDTFRHGGTLPN